MLNNIVPDILLPIQSRPQPTDRPASGMEMAKRWGQRLSEPRRIVQGGNDGRGAGQRSFQKASTRRYIKEDETVIDVIVDLCIWGDGFPEGSIAWFTPSHNRI